MSRRYVLTRAAVRAVVGLAFGVWSPCAASVIGGAL